MKRGWKVKMGQSLKQQFRDNDCAEHVDEFENAIGVVDGPVVYNATERAVFGHREIEPSKSGEPVIYGPEVDVWWLPSWLRYGYHPDNLQVVNMIIAVDGPAASGKGTLAKKIAAHYKMSFLDTGALYRATARDYLALGGDIDNVDLEQVVRAAQNIDAATLDDPALREPAIGDAASKVAPVPQVRTALLDYQRRFAQRPQGAVLDGRDIGTIVCPDATVKLFIQADVEVRAHRRFAELQGKGLEVSEQEVLEDLRERDERDRSRDTAPLVAAADAHLLDTTNLDIEGSCRAAIKLIDAALEQGGKMK